MPTGRPPLEDLLRRAFLVTWLAVCLAGAFPSSARPPAVQQHELFEEEADDPAAILAPSPATDYGSDTLSFSAPIYFVDERSGKAKITVLRSGGGKGKVSATLLLGDGTARPGTDLSPAQVRFSVTRKVGVKLRITKDGENEQTETVQLLLIPDQGVQLGSPASALLVIRGTAPDDPLAANAGPDREIGLGQSVSLCGAAGGAIGAPSFRWSLVSQPSGSSIALSNPAATMQTIVPQVAGAYVLSLVATDAVRTSAAASVRVNVLPAPPPEPVEVYVSALRFSAEANGTVDPASRIGLDFTGPVDPGSLTADGIQLSRETAAGSDPVPFDLAFDETTNALTLTPRDPLPLDGFFRLRVPAAGSTVEPFAFTPFEATFLTPRQRFSFVSGTVLDPDRKPLEGVTIRVAGQQQLTDANGGFFFENVAAGPQELEIDPSTVEMEGVLAPLHFTIEVVPGVRENGAGMSIVLSCVDTGRSVPIPGAVVATNPSLPGLSIDFTGVTPRNPDGTPYQGPVSVSRVLPPNVPMPFPGASSTFWTVQPGGLLLSPPARITVGLPIRMDPGREVGLWGFDHHTYSWVRYGRGTVNADGLTATSLPGEGLPFTGWGAVITRDEVVRSVGLASGRRAPSVPLPGDLVGRVEDADGFALHGVQVTTVGGETIFTDYDGADFDGTIDGSYHFSSLLVGYNVFRNGEFERFEPQDPEIQAVAQDLTGASHRGFVFVDVSSLADPGVPDGGLPDVLEAPTIRIGDYSAFRNGRIVLHKDQADPRRSHVVKAEPNGVGGLPIIDPHQEIVASERYRREVRLLSRKLASMGFREDYDGAFLEETEECTPDSALQKAVGVFRGLWFKGTASTAVPENKEALIGPRLVDQATLEAINAVDGVVWSRNDPFRAFNGFPYQTEDGDNRWLNGASIRELALLAQKTAVNSASPAPGGPRRGLPHAAPWKDEHAVGESSDLSMVATGGGTFSHLSGSTFYRCLRTNLLLPTCAFPVPTDRRGVPTAELEWTLQDIFNGITSEAAAIAAGRRWTLQDGYSRDLTRAFIDEMRALDQKHIIYNDPAIPNLVRVPAHQHHIHTLWKFRHDDILGAGSDGAPIFAPVRAADEPPLRATTTVDRRLAHSPGRPMPALDGSTFTALCFAPGDSDDGASTTDPLVVLFSQPVDPGSLAPGTVFLLEYNSGRTVPAGLVLDAERMQLELTPNAPLSELTLYTLTVDGVRSAAGTLLENPGAIATFTTGLDASVESAEIVPSPLVLARNDLSAARVSVVGRRTGGVARDLADGVFEYVVTDAAGHDLSQAADERGRLLRVFNGRSTLDAQVFGGPPATGFIEAALLDEPLVPARIEVGRPVTATFLEPVSAPPLQFVSARVATADGEEQETAATLEDDGRTLTVTPVGLLPRGRPLELFVTLRVTDPALRTIEVVTVSPFLAVGSVPADLDTDGDGLTDLFEATLSCGDPNSADADRDGTTDDREDCDGDGLTNAREQSLLTDPDNPDSDADGVNDRFELTAGCDPRLKQTANVTGRVVDSVGAPVAGVQVVPLIAPSVTTTTDAAGSFTLAEYPTCPPSRAIASGVLDGKPARGVSGLVSTTAGTEFDAGNIRLHPVPRFPYPEPRFDAGNTVLKALPADFNGDGTMDVLATAGGEGPAVLLGAGEGAFGAPQKVGGASNDGDGAVGDFDGDGSADVAVTVFSPTGTVIVALGKGDGTFRTPFNLAVTGRADEIAAGDLDGDGRDDLVVLSTVVSTRNVSVLLATGGGAFGPATLVLAGEFASLQNLTMSDLDRDGDLDVALGGTGLTILRGNGNGTLDPQPQEGFVQGLRQFVAADVDADSTLDVVGHSNTFQAIVALHGRGDLTFALPSVSSIAPRSGFGTVGVADFDTDGTLDVAFGSDFDGVVQLSGRGDGSFGGFRSLYAGSSGAGGLVPADWDRDGTIDLVVPLPNDQSITLLRGTGSGTFAARTGATAGDAPRDAALADLNADGTLDAVVANVSSNDFSILLGRGDGTFLPDVRVDAGCTQPSVVRLGDLDHDGDLDIAGACGSVVTVARGAGDGSFSPATAGDFLGDFLHAAALGDLTGDGTLDFVVAVLSRPPVLLQGNGIASFLPPRALNAPADTRNAAIGDVTGDGTNDLVIYDPSGRFSVMAGQGGGALAAPAAVSDPVSSKSFKLVDVDGDGVLDILEGGRDLFGLLRGNGDGTFLPPILGPSGRFGGGGEVDAADIDLDGRLDILVTSGSSIAVCTSLGDGSFADPVFFGTGQSPDPVVAGDLNGDGLPDLFVPFNNNIDAISILLRQ